ncbi:hypothetical protein E5288_WYG020487 [Bos mutus]|uniref:Uncharacterized protein n=1 Tax=Bos mutus TaxID=72004 RepID=A0A6B0S5E1_9CETA|nr:hypothetical protein [Bos mutus]
MLSVAARHNQLPFPAAQRTATPRSVNPSTLVPAQGLPTLRSPLSTNQLYFSKNEFHMGHLEVEHYIDSYLNQLDFSFSVKRVIKWLLYIIFSIDYADIFENSLEKAISDKNGER